MSKKGYLLALLAVLVGRFFFRPTLVTFHGGLSQAYFPRHDSWKLHHAFRILFRLAGNIACDSSVIKQAIESYGIRPAKVTPIATFSSQYLNFVPRALADDVEQFLAGHRPVFFSYVSFRPEYRLDLVRECIRLYRRRYPEAGFIWLGFPAKELPAAREFADGWSKEEQSGILILGNLEHDEFLTLMTRCFAYLRSPACDGVAASVLEALALGVPVVASENGRRPAGVLTYDDSDAADMCANLIYLAEHYDEIKEGIHPDQAGDNVGLMADWLVGNGSVGTHSRVVHAI